MKQPSAVVEATVPPPCKRQRLVRRCLICKSTDVDDSKHGELYCRKCKRVIHLFEVFDETNNKVIARANPQSLNVRWFKAGSEPEARCPDLKKLRDF
jgi:hypothetical protein